MNRCGIHRRGNEAGGGPRPRPREADADDDGAWDGWQPGADQLLGRAGKIKLALSTRDVAPLDEYDDGGSPMKMAGGRLWT